MVISKKFRYALLAYIDLGISYNKEKRPIRVSEISNRQGISPAFLGNIFHIFIKKGILKSLKGRNGGFVPALPLNKLTVFDIMKIIENPFEQIDCLKSNNGCSRRKECPTASFWQSFSMDVYGLLSKITIQSIMEEYSGFSNPQKPPGKGNRTHQAKEKNLQFN